MQKYCNTKTETKDNTNKDTNKDTTSTNTSTNTTKNSILRICKKETTTYSKWAKGNKTGDNIENKYEYYGTATEEYYTLERYLKTAHQLLTQ